MTRVIGVRFRTAGKIYFFDPLNFEIKRGDHVIVETARGIEFGTVMTGITEVEDEKVVQPLKPVIRIANERDHEQEANNKIKEKDAFRVCLEKIKKHELDMKLIDAEYTFDNNKVLFYFTADGRIDFRELVKDLAGVFKTRIELRQIGVRDETKIVGGIGICGRPLCCHSYLADFIPVSIKMAKEQNLSLNPTKISGVCGRLMCCLKNEEETYEELNRRLPGVGDYVVTDDGLKGEVQSVNVLRQLVKVVVMDGDAKEIKEYPVEKLQFRRRHGKKEKMELSREELRELEKLEKEEQQEGDGQQENEQRQGGKGRGRQGSEQRREGRDRQNGEQRREGRERRSNEQRREGRECQNGEQRREGREYRNGEQRREEGEGQEGNNCQNGEQHREGREYRNGKQRREGKEYRSGEQYREGGEGQEGNNCQNGEQHREGREYRNGRQRREEREYRSGEQRREGGEGQEGNDCQNGEQYREGREYRNGRQRREGREYRSGEQHREGRDRQDGGQRRDHRNRQEGDQRQHGHSRYDHGSNSQQRQEGQPEHNDNQSEG